MNILLVLMVNDLRAFRAWFATQTLSKIFVALGFCGIFGLITAGLYYGTSYFFYILAPLRLYGSLTAEYILRAAILLIFFLGVGSSAATTAGLVFSLNKNYAYLLTLPLKPREIVRWIFIKNSIVNLIILTVFLLPIILAFGKIFNSDAALVFHLKSVWLLVELTLLTGSAGGAIAIGIIKKVRKPNMIVNPIGGILFFLMVAAVFKLVFPHQMGFLAASSNEQFFHVYNSLPLVSNLIPTNWLVLMFTDKTLLILLLNFGLTFLVTAGYLILLDKNLIELARLMSAEPVTQEKSVTGKNLFDVRSLESKDLAVIVRSPTEAGYGAFILLLMVFFFGLFSQINMSSEYDPVWIKNLAVFFYAGFVFFTNTYLLRLVFPLMASESGSAWYIFAQPIDRVKVLWAKVRLAMLLGGPILLIALFIWPFISLVQPYQMILTASSVWTIACLILIQVLMGAINPNFADGNSPEKVSTSTMGITTLVLTSLLGLVFAYSIYKYLFLGVTMGQVMTMQAGIGIIVVLVLTLISQKAITRYEF